MLKTMVLRVCCSGGQLSLPFDEEDEEEDDHGRMVLFFLACWLTFEQLLAARGPL